MVLGISQYSTTTGVSFTAEPGRQRAALGAAVVMRYTGLHEAATVSTACTSADRLHLLITTAGTGHDDHVSTLFSES